MALRATAVRRGLCGLAVTGGLIVAGCGGSSSDESTKAATTAYARSVNAFCRDVKTATGRFQRSATSLGSTADPSRAARTFGTALESLADGFARGTDRLRDADPPSQYERFNADAVTALDRATSRLRSVAKTARSGDVDALGSIGSQLGDLKVPDGPSELQAQAPDCRA